MNDAPYIIRLKHRAHQAQQAYPMPCEAMLGTESAVLKLIDDFDALAQQLAASESGRTAYKSMLEQAEQDIKQAQATITRLEATINKALDLDYRRRQEIAEAVGLLRHIDSDMPKSFREGWKAEIDSYLAAHEGKEND